MCKTVLNVLPPLVVVRNATLALCISCTYIKFFPRSDIQELGLSSVPLLSRKVRFVLQSGDKRLLCTQNKTQWKKKHSSSPLPVKNKTSASKSKIAKRCVIQHFNQERLIRKQKVIFMHGERLVQRLLYTLGSLLCSHTFCSSHRRCHSHLTQRSSRRDGLKRNRQSGAYAMLISPTMVMSQGKPSDAAMGPPTDGPSTNQRQYTLQHALNKGLQVQWNTHKNN